MKLQLLGALFAGLGLLLTLQSVSGGRAAIGGQDRTGSPGSLSVDCALCHAVPGLFSNPLMGIVVKDAMGTTVTSYVPGDTYTLEFTVTSGGTPAGYGMQGVVLDASNNNIGDMVTASTANTQLVTIGNGREFIEHSGRSSTGVFSTTWEAPIAGTGAITVYGIGMAVDGSSTSGDNTSPTAQLTLTESPASSVGLVSGGVSNFDLYPIPNNGTFTIKNRGEGGQTLIRVIDLQGHVVYEHNEVLENFGTHTIYCKNLVPGTYAVEVECKGIRQVESMIVL